MILYTVGGEYSCKKSISRRKGKTVKLTDMIKPTLKDTIILIVGMIIMSIAGAGINKLVLYFSLNDTLPGFLLSLLLLAPFYFPVALHFVKMCTKQDKNK